MKVTLNNEAKTFSEALGISNKRSMEIALASMQAVKKSDGRKSILAQELASIAKNANELVFATIQTMEVLFLMEQEHQAHHDHEAEQRPTSYGAN